LGGDELVVVGFLEGELEALGASEAVVTNVTCEFTFVMNLEGFRAQNPFTTFK
jgi:hypothetical protein